MADGAVFCANRNQDAVVVCSTVVMVEQGISSKVMKRFSYSFEPKLPRIVVLGHISTQMV